MVSFAKAADNQGASCQAGKACGALMNPTQLRVKHHVLVHLVAYQQYVGRCQQVLQRQHVGFRPHRGAWVVRRVDDDGAGLGRHGSADFVKVRAKRAWSEGNAYHHATCQLDVGHIAVVAGLQHDDFITRVDDGQDGGDDGLRRASGDGDLGGRVEAAAVQLLQFAGNRLAQHRYAGHRRVLVQALQHSVGHGIDQLRVAVKIWEALPQIDGVVFRCQG